MAFNGKLCFPFATSLTYIFLTMYCKLKLNADLFLFFVGKQNLTLFDQQMHIRINIWLYFCHLLEENLASGK